MRGEQYAGRIERLWLRGSPPLARGTVQGAFEKSCRKGITPACAGNSEVVYSLLSLAQDHPRLRGEQWLTPVDDPTHPGSPPLARGTVPPHPFFKVDAGITPACAGNSGLRPWTTPRIRDHPRLRGEQIRLRQTAHGAQGSPPLARGTVLVLGLSLPKNGITPACAGNSRRRRKNTAQNRDHPRLRGEQCRRQNVVGVIVGSPPLARGTGPNLTPEQEIVRITPACAGNRLKKDLLYLVFYNIVFHFSISFS